MAPASRLMKPDPIAAPPVMELRGVTKRFGAVTALDRVDLGLRGGEVTAILGPNGAGKTTAVRLLLGLARPSKGRVQVLGGDPSASAIRMRMGAMMQIASVPETLRVEEHVELFSSYYPAPLPPAEVLRVAGLEGLEKRSFGKLSGGQQRRLLFALAICGNPELLFLDEPTVGLDVASRRSFWRHTRELARCGRTILLTTHYLEEADALADRVVVLHRGAVVADGSPNEIKARAVGRRVRARTRIEVDELPDWPGLRRVRRDGEMLEFLTSEPEIVVREILGRDPGLTDLEVTSAGLEEAFLSLTDDADLASQEKGAV